MDFHLKEEPCNLTVIGMEIMDEFSSSTAMFKNNHKVHNPAAVISLLKVRLFYDVIQHFLSSSALVD